MISWSEILGSYKELDIPAEHLINLRELYGKVNLIRGAYGNPMSPSNCYRSLEHHLRIYKDKGITDKSKIPMASKHLYGFAIDIADASGDFHKWCKANDKILRSVGIWLEERQGGWQHLQIRPFGSFKEGGTLWFNP